MLYNGTTWKLRVNLIDLFCVVLIQISYVCIIVTLLWRTRAVMDVAFYWDIKRHLKPAQECFLPTKVRESLRNIHVIQLKVKCVETWNQQLSNILRNFVYRNFPHIIKTKGNLIKVYYEASIDDIWYFG